MRGRAGSDTAQQQGWDGAKQRGLLWTSRSAGTEHKCGAKDRAGPWGWGRGLGKDPRHKCGKMVGVGTDGRARWPPGTEMP